MLTRLEKKLVKNRYFTVINDEHKFIEVKSNNTGHIWMIFRKALESNRPVVLYHKHTMDEWYHEQYRSWTVEDAVKEIKRHDAYVVRHPDYMRRKKLERYYARQQY